jgi:KUP system potassium uptake protein
MSTPAILENGHNNRRSAVTLHGFPLVVLTFQTLGIIYSDIGTSPLYVLNGLWPASGDVPSEENIIGGISAIIWFLTILPLIKYVFISLHFGTYEGEGGTFALFQGLFPPEDSDFDSDRTLTGI